MGNQGTLMDYLMDIQVIPIFINNIDDNHIKVRHIALDTMTVFSNVFDDKFINPIRMNKFKFLIIKLLNQMFDTDQNIAILYYDHIFNLLDYYRNRLLEDENYESTKNLEELVYLVDPSKGYRPPIKIEDVIE